MKKYTKSIASALFILLVLPNITFASWWNPFSWSVISYLFTKPQTTQLIATSTIVVKATSSTKIIVNTPKANVSAPDNSAAVKVQAQLDEQAKIDTAVKAALAQQDAANLAAQNAANVAAQQAAKNNTSAQSIISPITVSCFPNQASTTIGSSVTWTAEPTDINASAGFYSWSGDGGLTGTGKSISWTYFATGTKSAEVMYTNSNGKTAIGICGENVNIFILPPINNPSNCPCRAGDGSTLIKGNCLCGGVQA